MTEKMKWKGHICAVLINPDGSRETVETHNLITTKGLEIIAQVMNLHFGTGTPTPNTFSQVALGTGSGAVAVGDTLDDVGVAASAGLASADSGYPKLNDNDGDNSGAGANVLTWRAQWGVGVYTNTITNVAITTSTAAHPTSAEDILNHSQFSSSIVKGAGQALKVFVNVEIT